MLRQVIVGVYSFGFERGTLILREGKSANAEFTPTDKGLVKFFIGAEERQWRDIVESLIHEVQEVIMTKMECSWHPGFYIGNDSARYQYQMSHTQFQEMCCRTAEFITPALPDLAKAWNKWKKPPYVKWAVICPECQKPDRKILIKALGRENHYRCDHCGHDFISWKGAAYKKVKK